MKGIKVTIGGQMSDQEKLDAIRKFREEFESNEMIVNQISSAELHGYSETRTHF